MWHRFDDISIGGPRLAMSAAAAVAVLAAGLPSASAQDAGGGDGQAEQQASGGPSDDGGSLQRSDRMEFDARLIRGQRASGAVFLFQRAPRELPSMVERRRTFLEASVRSVLGTSWAETFVENRAEHVDDQDGGDSQ